MIRVSHLELAKEAFGLRLSTSLTMPRAKLMLPPLSCSPSASRPSP